MNLVAVFLDTLNVTLPVFAMVFLGIGLKRIGWIDQAFVATASLLIFNATLPTLIFISLARADLDIAFNPGVMLFFLAATLIGFAFSWVWATYRVPKQERGVYVQGAFRGNCGVVGLALAASLYGDYGLSAGSVLLGLVILSYNTLSVVVLAIYQPDKSTNWRSLGASILRNPLILAVVVSLPFALFSLELPDWLMISGEYFASLTLPLALICIGATLSIKALKSEGSIALGASLMKMVTLPVLGTIGAWLSGFTGRELGLLFVFFASPTAAASFVMVKAFGGNAGLAANIIALTTLMASITITLGVFALRALALI